MTAKITKEKKAKHENHVDCAHCTATHATNYTRSVSIQRYVGISKYVRRLDKPLGADAQQFASCAPSLLH